MTKSEIIDLVIKQNDVLRATVSPMVLTVDQVASLLQIEPKAVIRLRNQRKIAFVKIGGQLRFRIKDVEDYLSRSVQPCRQQNEYSESEEWAISRIGATRTPDGSEDAAIALALAEKLKKRHRSPA